MKSVCFIFVFLTKLHFGFVISKGNVTPRDKQLDQAFGDFAF